MRNHDENPILEVEEPAIIEEQPKKPKMVQKSPVLDPEFFVKRAERPNFAQKVLEDLDKLK